MDAGIKFDLMLNYANEFLIVFDQQPGTAKAPQMDYKGGDTAVLYKNNKADGIVFSPIPEEAESLLLKAKKILCVEVSDKKVVNEFYAVIKNED